MTRSLKALLRGDLVTSFLYNPFTEIFFLLLFLSAVAVVRCLVHRKPVMLPAWLASVWFVSLALAWVAKFLIGQKYW